MNLIGNRPIFYRARRPAGDELNRLLETHSRRIVRVLERRGLWIVDGRQLDGVASSLVLLGGLVGFIQSFDQDVRPFFQRPVESVLVGHPVGLLGEPVACFLGAQLCAAAPV